MASPRDTYECLGVAAWAAEFPASVRCWVTDLYIGSAGWIHCQRLDIADVTKELAAVRQSLAMRFQHIDRDSVTAGENQRGGLSIAPVIYEFVVRTKSYWPVRASNNSVSLARRFQKAGGPAGQCLLWRPAGVTSYLYY